MKPLFAWIFVLVLCCGGCKPHEDPPVKVTGIVLLDQEPLKEGEIQFKTPGQVPTFGDIKEGKFELMVKVGKKEVEILAYRQAPDFNMGGVIIKGSRENYIPERFNTKTSLIAEVTANGPNDFKFEVTSK